MNRPIAKYLNQASFSFYNIFHSGGRYFIVKRKRRHVKDTGRIYFVGTCSKARILAPAFEQHNASVARLSADETRHVCALPCHIHKLGSPFYCPDRDRHYVASPDRHWLSHSAIALVACPFEEADAASCWGAAIPSFESLLLTAIGANALQRVVALVTTYHAERALDVL